MPQQLCLQQYVKDYLSISDLFAAEGILELAFREDDHQMSRSFRLCTGSPGKVLSSVGPWDNLSAWCVDEEAKRCPLTCQEASEGHLEMVGNRLRSPKCPEKPASQEGETGSAFYANFAWQQGITNDGEAKVRLTIKDCSKRIFDSGCKRSIFCKKSGPGLGELLDRKQSSMR